MKSSINNVFRELIKIKFLILAKELFTAIYLLYGLMYSKKYNFVEMIHHIWLVALVDSFLKKE